MEETTVKIEAQVQKKETFWKRPYVRMLSISILLGFIFTLGYSLGQYRSIEAAQEFPDVTLTRDLPEGQKDLDFQLFWKVWDSVSDSYYDKSKIIESEMVYGAIRGMVSAIGDPYTVFLPPNQNKVFQSDLKGNFGGVGIELGYKETQLAVIAPLPGTPADKAGVLAGDLILKIVDEEKEIDKETGGMAVNEAVQIIRGEVGKPVKLTLYREGQEKPFDVELVRATIDVPSIKYEDVGENRDIAHIRVSRFAGDTVKEWDNAISDIVLKPNIKAVIVDVRNNPGGYMYDAIEMGSDFIDRGKIILKEENTKTGNKEYKVEKIGRLLQKPVIVLVNGGSASASEILAGALRDEDSAKLVGQKTFGKGTIQEPMQVDGGAGLNVTIAKWLTPSGYWVHGEGLKPDVEIENNPDTTEDEQLEKAIEIAKQL